MSESVELVRLSPQRQRVDEWALALASAGIDSRTDPTATGWALSVRAVERDRAEAVLGLFDAENQRRPAPPPDPLEPGTSRGAYVVAGLLCAFFVVTGPRDDGSAWFVHGEAASIRIATGEWWRTVTALTLHADFPHILGNALTLIIFGSALFGLLGTGVGLWVMLLSGTVGNWLTASLHGSAHRAVGASTAIFGSLGALAAIQLVRRRRGASVSIWRAAAPLAAGIGLLGFLGTSPQADVLAHLFGFAIGIGLGGALAFGAPPLRQWPRLQGVLAVAAAVAVLLCWGLAWS